MAAQPNIVLIITDQQRYDTVRALGAAHMVTPTLDRLVKEGTSFTHAYTAGASCVPARASLFTGYFPHTIGVLRNTDGWSRSWVEQLNSAGYHCVNVGKMHTVPYDASCGFHERYIVENKERRTDFAGRQNFDLLDVLLGAIGANRLEALNYRSLSDYEVALGAFEWPLDEELHHDFLVGNLAKWWLREHRRRRDSKKPVFIQIGFPGPHPPYDPIARYLELYRNADLDLPPITDDDLNSQPRAFRDMRNEMVCRQPDSIVHQVRPSRDARMRQRRHYYANVSMIDQYVGEILATLQTETYLDDCVLVFTSDHGDALTEHGQCTKWTMYEPVVRVPLLFWGPGRVPANRRIEGLVQIMDLGPTLHDMAGVDRGTSIEAISLASSFGEQAFIGRSHVFCEHGRDRVLEGTDLVTMVRTRDWKLVHFVDDAYGQLFNLQDDPQELENLWDRNAEKRRELLTELTEWRLRSQVQARGWSAARR